MANSRRRGFPRVSSRLARALRGALKAHGAPTRKGTTIPYVSHLLAVASLVLDYGGSEDPVVAALRHATVEDCGVSYAQLRRQFGAPVARIVKDCTDAETFPKPPWKARKQRYIDHLRRAHHPSALRVSAADKLHNARAIVHDVKHHGQAVWKRFHAAPAEILWYYQSLCAIFRRRARSCPPPAKIGSCSRNTPPICDVGECRGTHEGAAWRHNRRGRLPAL
jgi:(p)ppGpp synthase/HD superfamily hydrolase